MDAVGWAAVLPQMLAALGVVFARGGGRRRGRRRRARAISRRQRLARRGRLRGSAWPLFTMIMGNAFAAFPVMAAAIGVPLLVQPYPRQSGGDRRDRHARRLLRDLMTPMAANFNIVPAALLELKDRNAVIKAQIGTAIPLLLSTSR